METHAVILYPENGQRGISGDCRFLTILSDWSAHLLGAGTVRVQLRLVGGDESVRGAKKSGQTGRG
jgi:hypothetical protein